MGEVGGVGGMQMGGWEDRPSRKSVTTQGVRSTFPSLSCRFARARDSGAGPRTTCAIRGAVRGDEGSGGRRHGPGAFARATCARDSKRGSCRAMMSASRGKASASQGRAEGGHWVAADLSILVVLGAVAAAHELVLGLPRPRAVRGASHNARARAFAPPLVQRGSG
jgi:hypothetical protein